MRKIDKGGNNVTMTAIMAPSTTMITHLLLCMNVYYLKAKEMVFVSNTLKCFWISLVIIRLMSVRLVLCVSLWFDADFYCRHCARAVRIRQPAGCPEKFTQRPLGWSLAASPPFSENSTLCLQRLPGSERCRKRCGFAWALCEVHLHCASSLLAEQIWVGLFAAHTHIHRGLLKSHFRISFSRLMKPGLRLSHD